MRTFLKKGSRAPSVSLPREAQPQASVTGDVGRQTARLVWPGSCKEGAPRGSRVPLHVAEGLAAAGQDAWRASCSGGTRTTPLLQGPSSESSDTQCMGRMRSWVSPTAEQEVMDGGVNCCAIASFSSTLPGKEVSSLWSWSPNCPRWSNTPEGHPLHPGDEKQIHLLIKQKQRGINVFPEPYVTLNQDQSVQG